MLQEFAAGTPYCPGVVYSLYSAQLLANGSLLERERYAWVRACCLSQHKLQPATPLGQVAAAAGSRMVARMVFLPSIGHTYTDAAGIYIGIHLLDTKRTHLMLLQECTSGGVSWELPCLDACQDAPQGTPNLQVALPRTRPFHAGCIALSTYVWTETTQVRFLLHVWPQPSGLPTCSPAALLMNQPPCVPCKEGS